MTNQISFVLFFSLTFLACSSDESNIYENLSFNGSEFLEAGYFYASGPNPIFSDTTLFLRRSEEYVYPRTYYTLEGELFTGTQNWFYEISGDLDQTIEIQDGVVIKAIRFNGDGSELLKSEYYDQNGDTTYHRFFENGVLSSTSKEWSYQEGSIVYSFGKGSSSDGKSFYSEQERDLTTAYHQNKLYRNGILFHQQYHDDEISTMKSYHNNGQLRSERTAKNNGNQNYWLGEVVLHGLQSVFDEQGNILKQERYENGILIETIK